MNGKTIKDIIRVFISKFISLVSGILVAFLLPKITSVEGFGYYKTFTLYVSYIGLLHFGLSDGVYLKYGGCDYETIDVKQFRLYFRVLSFLEIFISGILLLGAVLFAPADLKFVLVTLSVYTYFHIIGSYYQQVSQTFRRFKEFSNRIIIYSIFKLLGVLLLFVLYFFSSGEVDYRYYIVFLVVTEVALCIWYLYTYRLLSFGEHNKVSNNRREIAELFKIGFPLLVTNLATTFLLNIDRQFVNLLFDKEVYATYAFAYSLLTLVTMTTSSVATVLYPNMKRDSLENLEVKFDSYSNAISSLSFGGLLLYFPLDVFIRWFLPKYSDSLPIFRIIFPGLAISSVINIILYNYYKVINRTLQFLVINIITLIMSALANGIAFLLFRNTISISIASIIVMFIWYIVSHIPLAREYKIKWGKNTVYLVIMTGLFYGISLLFNSIIGFVIYFAVFSGLTILLQPRGGNLLINILKKRLKKG